MADLKALAETLVNLTIKDVTELTSIMEEEYNIKPAAAAVAVAAGPAGDGGGALAVGTPGYSVPHDSLKSEASLSLFYEDSLALSSNAAAVQQFMVNESVLSQKPVSQTAPAMDGLQM